MALTDPKIKKAKPRSKPYKLADEKGLFILIKPNGSKLWRYKYRISGKEGLYSIGVYPAISLKEARTAHQIAKEHVVKGIHPKNIKDDAKQKVKIKEQRLSTHFDNWINKKNLAEATKQSLMLSINKNLKPYLDTKPVNKITTRDLLDVLLKVTDRGSFGVAIKLISILRRVFNELLLLQLIENNPANGLIELLPDNPNSGENFSHITDKQTFRNLLINIDNYNGDIATKTALQLMPHVFLRPTNLRHLRWSQIDFEKRQIVIDAKEMKGKKNDHVVPLSTQAIQIIKSIYPLTKHNAYVFVSSQSKGKPISEGTATRAFSRMINPATHLPYGVGFMTSHGFRHTASTFLNEMGFNADVVELQLSHLSKDRIRAVYNKAQLLDKRVIMMQTWSNYLFALKESSNVTPIKQHG